MPDVARKVLALLSAKERRHAYMLLGMILVMAFLDVVGVASIMPFMAVLANPTIVESNEYLSLVYDRLEFSSRDRFLLFLGLLVFITLVVSISFKAVTTWAITSFTQMRYYSIAHRLVEAYLGQPYEWFLNRHSADLGKTALSEVQLVIQGAVVPLLHLLAQGVTIIAILLLLVAVDPSLALIVGGGIGGAYGLTYMGLRRLLNRIGKERVLANEMRFKAISEAFGGIKEIKVSGLERNALERFKIPAKKFAHTQVIAQVAGVMPRYALEIIAFGGMLLVILFLMGREEGLEQAIPVIALYALAGYRLMPALQLAYSHATKLRFSSDALDRLHEDLDGLRCTPNLGFGSDEALVLARKISLQHVTYTYPEAQRPSVEDLSLEISAQTTIGLVGATGSGKTTVVDIILGLLLPQKGIIRVDGKLIDVANRHLWQRAIGYVPQQIFLADESVAANIAFGVATEKIDVLAVQQAAETANLHRFVVEELRDGYETVIGERGVRLSGGQRQRIGIARALYHRPRVLILDEATSALDNLTEQAVMDAVHNLGGEITIILVAHRLSTVRECDQIFLLEDGRVAGMGSYNELEASSDLFRAISNT